VSKFGTSEDPGTVRADQLEPGVYVDGYHFNASFSVSIESVKPQEDGRVWVTAYDKSGNRYADRVFRPDRPITTWGRI
jgi:hypothetical protein